MTKQPADGSTESPTASDSEILQDHAAVADCFGLSPSNVAHWVKLGLPRNENGTFPRPECEAWLSERTLDFKQPYTPEFITTRRALLHRDVVRCAYWIELLESQLDASKAKVPQSRRQVFPSYVHWETGWRGQLLRLIEDLARAKEEWHRNLSRTRETGSVTFVDTELSRDFSQVGDPGKFRYGRDIHEATAHGLVISIGSELLAEIRHGVRVDQEFVNRLPVKDFRAAVKRHLAASEARVDWPALRVVLEVEVARLGSLPCLGEDMARARFSSDEPDGRLDQAGESSLPARTTRLIEINIRPAYRATAGAMLEALGQLGGFQPISEILRKARELGKTNQTDGGSRTVQVPRDGLLTAGLMEKEGKGSGTRYRIPAPPSRLWTGVDRMD